MPLRLAKSVPRLPEELVRDLEAIEKAEQSDCSTTVRKLLYKAAGADGVSRFKSPAWRALGLIMPLSSMGGRAKPRVPGV